MKKIVIFCLLMTLPIISYSQDLYRAVNNGDIRYIQWYIGNYYKNAQEYVYFSNSDLRIFRNTIYAMHGYIFNSRDLQEHFRRFEWYNGTKRDVENELTENERQVIRIILAMEAANPPTHGDLVGRWVKPVAASVESIGYIDYYLMPDGRIEGFSCNGRWSLEGTTFRTTPDSEYLMWADWPLDWSEEVENIRFTFVEYNGELYKACNFFNNILYESTLPLAYWDRSLQ
jgi:hypothetical protein